MPSSRPGRSHLGAGGHRRGTARRDMRGGVSAEYAAVMLAAVAFGALLVHWAASAPINGVGLASWWWRHLTHVLDLIRQLWPFNR